MAKKISKKVEQCSLFEEMLMWTSYRYCIGRHTYVVTMAYDIAQHYYNKLTDGQKEHAADDIRQQILHQLEFQPFHFHTRYIYQDADFHPLETFFDFLEKNHIESVEELLKYTSICCYLDFDDNNKLKISATKDESITPKSIMSEMEIDDLIPWMDLASCFDVKNHKQVKLINDEVVTVFESYHDKTEPIEDNPGYYRRVPFQWEKIYIAVDDFVQGRRYRYIPTENVKEIL